MRQILIRLTLSIMQVPKDALFNHFNNLRVRLYFLGGFLILLKKTDMLISKYQSRTDKLQLLPTVLQAL